MPKMTGARFLADMLQAYGVTHIFYAWDHQARPLRDG